ncbi:MAG: right-handed parallel beta-helix repeat-containing protein [Candidatus Aenigmatarchaeota archaeon]
MFTHDIKAETYVSGIIATDTIWTLSNSPYIVTGNIKVNEGVTLTIEPGVFVKFEKHPIFDRGYYIWIDGTLVARGTADQKIIFTSNSSNPEPGDWGAIYFSPTSTDWDEENATGSVIEYAIIEYGGSYQPGSLWQLSDNLISIDNSSPLIKNSLLRFTEADFLKISGASTTAKFLGNKFIGNSRSYRERIIISAGNPYFEGNEVIRSGGFYISGGSPKITKNNIIANQSDTYGGGIRIDWGSPAITYNNIINNSENGIVIYCGTCSPIITQNNIYNNEEFAIFLYGTSGNINATSNWWGTTTTTSIDKLIYDYKDDFNLGNVFYEPFLEEPATGTPPIDNIPPSPVTNVTSSRIYCGNRYFQIKWNNPSDEDLFTIRIYRSFIQDELGELFWESSRNTEPPDWYWYDETIELDKPYYYTVKAVDFWGNESEGAKITILIPSCDYTPPSPPSNVTSTLLYCYGGVELNQPHFQISWTNPTEEDFAGIRIYRVGDWGELIEEAELSTTSQKYEPTIPNLQPYVTYRYILKSFDNRDNESSGVEVRIIIPLCSPEIIFKVLSAYGEISSTSPNLFPITFTTSTNENFSGIRIYQSFKENEKGWQVAQLPKGINYYYTFRKVNSQNEESQLIKAKVILPSQSSSINIVFEVLFAEGEISSLDSFPITLIVPTDKNFSGIRIYQSILESILGIKVSEIVQERGATIYYTFKSFDSQNNESDLLKFKVIIPPSIVLPSDNTPPSLPTNGKVENITSENELKLKISWTNPPDEDLTGFHLYRSDDYVVDYGFWKGNLLQELKDLPENKDVIICETATYCYISPNATSIVDNFRLKNGVTYYYYLEPFDTSGNYPRPSGPRKNLAVTGIPQYPYAPGIQINSITWLKNFGIPDNTYLNGWRVKFEITVNDPEETQLQFKLADWISGSNKIPTLGNTKISLIDLKTENEIASAISVGTEYENMNPLTISDKDPYAPGIQTSFYIWMKIPNNTPAGTYSTFYGIKTTKPSL